MKSHVDLTSVFFLTIPYIAIDWGQCWQGLC
jgi:hypothetical protein